jgi:ABC-2 type transport system permease protein
MRMLRVTLKDLLQASRSLSIFMFMFVIPILVTLLFMVMFGNAGGNDDSFELPTTSVVVVNLDEGTFPTDQFAGSEITGVTGLDLSDVQNMGDLLTGILASEIFADLMSTSEAADETAGRAAVDNQEAGLVIIIPQDFTEAVTGQLATTAVRLYKDPTLTFGPTIVESIVAQIVDDFSANKITIGVSMQQLLASGVPFTQELPGLLVEQYAAYSSSQGMVTFGDTSDLIETKLPSGLEEPTDLITEIVSLIMAGMMVFFAFFTGAASVETILVEEERGTLARLFTTPNSHRTILGGKVLAAIFTVTIQVAVLLAFGRVIFKIDWGDPVPLILAGLGLVIVSAATGLFLVSLLDNTRQGGIIFGGVLTLTGMLGLIPVFTAGAPNQPESIKTVSLLVPQGWAIRGFTTAIDGGTVSDMLPILAVLLAWSLVFSFIGQYRLQRRFA